MDINLKEMPNTYHQVTKENAADVKMYLEHTYGEEFIPLRVGNRFNTNTATVYVRSGKNERVVVKAILHHSGSVDEDYVSQCILTQMSDSVVAALDSEGIHCDINATFGREIYETDKELTIPEFISKHGLKKVVFQMIFPNESMDAKMLIDALEGFAAREKLACLVYGNVLNEDGYSKCRQLYYDYPTVSKDIVREYEPVCSFSFRIEDGRSTLSADELQKIMEEGVCTKMSN